MFCTDMMSSLCCVSSLPDTPAEPDVEHEKVTGEPKVIPHDEVN